MLEGLSSPKLFFVKSVISKKSPARAWVEINQANLLHNLEVAKTRSGCEIMAVVKANAYGHGLIETARIFSEAGVAFLGVANVGEARIIREAGINTHIYLLGSTQDALAGDEGVYDLGFILSFAISVSRLL